MKIIFATGNAHKLSEAQNVIGEAFELTMPAQVGIEGEIPENGDTLEKNSAEKALYIWNLKHECCFADDTGLEVEALGGAPGVYTARYYSLPATFSNWDNNRTFADTVEANMQKLLLEIDAARESAIGKGEADPGRRARFRTVVTLVKEGNLYRFEGVLNGRIAEQRSGCKGFGYDPVFIPDNYDCTLAELTMEEKNAISHRGKAMRALADFLNNNAE